MHIQLWYFQTSVVMLKRGCGAHDLQEGLWHSQAGLDMCLQGKHCNTSLVLSLGWPVSKPDIMCWEDTLETFAGTVWYHFILAAWYSLSNKKGIRDSDLANSLTTPGASRPVPFASSNRLRMAPALYQVGHNQYWHKLSLRSAAKQTLALNPPHL